MAMIRHCCAQLFLLVLAIGTWQMLPGAPAAEASEIITLRSGNAPVGLADPYVNMIWGSGGAPLSLNPFTTQEFDSSCTVANAVVVSPISVWLQHLSCDPLAQWVGFDVNGSPVSALYCYNFDIQTCCIDRAMLQFCWASDDALGDVTGGGANPDGVYLNGVAVSPSISGGSYASETQVGPIDVTGLVQCGSNRLEVYNRDLGFVISGVIFSATLEIVECSVPTETSSFGQLKALYR